MTTEDMFISKNNWVEISGTKIIIYLDNGNELLYRFGAASTSKGHTLRQENTIVCDETVYIKSSVGDAEGCNIVVSR